MQLPGYSEPATNSFPLADLKEVLEKARVYCGIPGMSVAVLHKGKLIFAEGFGKRNEQEPFTVETLTSIASITKAFTAAAIGELVADGKADWDTTPVNKYLPEFEVSDPVLTSQLTFADLLSHRTGLPSLDFAWFRSTEKRIDLIKRIRHVPLDPKLRSKCDYNNIMYAVAGEAAANIAGTSYERLVETKILKPLGLSNTGFSVTEMKKRPNHAMPYDAASFEDAQKGNFILGYLDHIYMSDAPAGDLYSNVLDLVRWGRIIMKLGELDGKQVLNKESVTETLSGHTFMEKTGRSSEFAPALAYGFGWLIDSYKGQVLYHHSGSNAGFISNLAIYPDADLVIAHLTNIQSTGLPAFTSYYIADELLGLPKTQDWLSDAAIKDTQVQYDWQAKEAKGDFPEQQKDRPSSHRLEAFVGEYMSPVFGDVSICLETRDDDETEALYFKLRMFDSKMVHYHYDSFTTAAIDFAVEMALLVTFQTSADGTVVGFELKSDEIMVFKRRNVTKDKEAQE
ncbi:hypothetical protein BG011_009668 [Mortierella polycephala]|uniref:Beta-lactamase/transpeptidase-like protein n=1 Tax=Mortierella polycephala TaxID=41804 RepID=A0A9P6TWC5_9FUNG|nr:hypothetical protein BG011_009668 [Mortierella polycephala]